MHPFVNCQDEDLPRRRPRGWRFAITTMVLIGDIMKLKAGSPTAETQGNQMCDSDDTLCISACGKAQIATMRREAAVEAAPQWSVVARTARFLRFAAAVAPNTAVSCGQRYSANEAL